MDFNGFSVYRKYCNGEVVLLHIIKGNNFKDYRLAVELVYESWRANVPFTDNVILCPMPQGFGDYDIMNPIFSGKDINTEHEFDRDTFQYKYYGI